MVTGSETLSFNNDVNGVEEEAAASYDSSTANVHIMFPQLWGKRRSGEQFVRKLPAKLRAHDANVLKSFEAQDKIKNDYRTAEINGYDARFQVELPDGSTITFSKLLSDWMMENSQIAALYRAGWNIRVS